MEGDAPKTWLEAVRELDVPEELRDQLVAVTGSFVAYSGGDAPPPPRASYGRFLDLGLLGQGGVGEVRRVEDPSLGRVTAMKTLQWRWSAHAELRRRFVAEARLTAQLQHPGIPPVHEVGVLPDGRPHFTLPEVRGARLDDAIMAAHASRNPARLRRLVEVLRRVSETIQYAHSRGVVHRDLKPSNVMLGEYGEVWVLDWGLGKVHPAGRVEEDPPTNERAIQGTPTYMSPEQARGSDAVGPPADVYALGGLLHVVLTGIPPRPRDAEAALAAALQPEAPGPLQAEAWDVPEELADLCRRCLAPEITERPELAAVSSLLVSWLDGIRSRDRALEVLSEARAHAERADALKQEAEALRAEARRNAPDATRDQEAWWPSWDLEDRAVWNEEEAAVEEARADMLAQAALSHAPALADTKVWLADRALERHRRATKDTDAPTLARDELTLQRFGVARHAAYLAGRASVSLTADPDGAEAFLYRWVTRRRLMELELVRPLGRTPLVEVPLDHGSWVIELRHPERAPVRWPLLVERGGHAENRRPGGTGPHPIYLPRRGELGPDDCYVPAGHCLVGRNHELDLDIPSMPLTKVWVDGFVVRRFPVTTEDYLAYLAALQDAGQHEQAIEDVPHRRGEPRLRLEEGRFAPGEGPHGEVWEARSPMVMLTWPMARRYAAWRARTDGLPWRLGWEIEWEKAARGADGRPYPWGWNVHATWARIRATPDVSGTLSAVHDFETDRSVFGVRGLGGNAADWVVDPYPEGFCPVVNGVAVAPDPGDAPRRRIKGGCHDYRPFDCRSDGQGSGRVFLAHFVTTRLFRPLDPHGGAAT
ncbi:MAG: bifunctional serine/threonine-protein kinase/formylglycine-generating enzyme family protein [Myxococcota bacterium]